MYILGWKVGAITCAEVCFGRWGTRRAIDALHVSAGERGLKTLRLAGQGPDKNVEGFRMGWGRVYHIPGESAWYTKTFLNE